MGPFSEVAAGFQNVRTTSRPYGEIVESMELSIAANGLWVLGKVDAQAFVRRAGYVIPGTVQVLAFHPRYMVRLLEADQAALLAAPLKFAVVEKADGAVAVSWSNQVSAFGHYDSAALRELGEELASLCVIVVEQALDI
jgi:uncharacterized protein (DUF302 family)